MRFPIVLSTFCVVAMLFSQAFANPMHDLQKILVLQGYDIGKIDGIIGRNTISKLKQFCSSNSLNCENLIADKKSNCIAFDSFKDILFYTRDSCP